MAEIDGGYIRIHIVDTGDSNNITLTLHPNYIVENSPANTVVGKCFHSIQLENYTKKSN